MVLPLPLCHLLDYVHPCRKVQTVQTAQEFKGNFVLLSSGHAASSRPPHFGRASRQFIICQQPKPSKTGQARTPTIIRSGREQEKPGRRWIGQNPCSVVGTFCVPVVVHEVG